MSKLSDFLSLFHTSLFQNTVNRTRPKYRLFTNLKNKQTKIAAAIPRNSASHEHASCILQESAVSNASSFVRENERSYGLYSGKMLFAKSM